MTTKPSPPFAVIIWRIINIFLSYTIEHQRRKRCKKSCKKKKKRKIKTHANTIIPDFFPKNKTKTLISAQKKSQWPNRRVNNETGTNQEGSGGRRP